MATCAKCDRKAGKFLGLCSPHYSNFLRDRRGTPRRYSDLGDPLTCNADETCSKPIHSMGLCNAHYQMVAKGGPAPIKKCPITGCEVDIFASTETCKKHRQFMWRYSLTTDRCIELHYPRNRICSNTGCLATDNLALDHDHACCNREKYGTSHKVSCGECVRGWLCSGCNRALGCINDSPQKLRGLIEFLERN